MPSAIPLAGTMFPKQGLVGVVVGDDLAVALPESDVFQVGLCQLQVGEGDGIAINRDIPFVSGVFQQSNLAHGLESAGVAEAMRRLVLDSAIQIKGMRPSSLDMAYTAVPSTWLGSGYTLSGSGATAAINFGINGNTNPTFTEITAAEANATTGEIRKILYGVVEGIYQKYLVVAATPANLPNRLTISKSASVNSTTGLITANYSFQFVLEASGLEVTAEAV